MTTVEDRGITYRRWLWIDMEWQHAFAIRLHREAWWDRIAKALRFAREHQTGDAAFDPRVYIAVDEPAAASALCDSPNEREALLRLLDLGALDLFGAHNAVVPGAQGQLRIRFRWQDGFSKEAVPSPETDAARAWLAEAIAASRALLANAPSHALEVRTSRLRSIVEVTGIILSVTFIVSLLAWWASSKIVDPAYEVRGLGRGLTIALGIGAAGLLLLALRVAGRATAARLWLGAVGLIVPLAVMLPVGLVPVLNDTLDTSQPRTVVTPVLDKWISTGRRGRKSFNVSVRYWAPPFQRETFTVSSAVYDGVEPGRDCISAQARDGGLGFVHVVGYAITPCGDGHRDDKAVYEVEEAVKRAATQQ